MRREQKAYHKVERRLRSMYQELAQAPGPKEADLLLLKINKMESEVIRTERKIRRALKIGA